MAQHPALLLWKEIMYLRKKWNENWYLKKAIRARARAKKLADWKHQTDGKRYYVLPNANGDLMALNSIEIGQLKRAKIMSKKVDVNALLREALYFTGMDAKEEESRKKTFLQVIMDDIRRSRLTE